MQGETTVVLDKTDEVCQAVFRIVDGRPEVRHVHPDRVEPSSMRPFLGTLKFQGKTYTLKDKGSTEPEFLLPEIDQYGVKDPADPKVLILADGDQYGFPEVKVRGGEASILRFLYRISPGTEGDAEVIVRQFGALPGNNFVGPSETLELKKVGVWTEVRKSIRLAPDTSSIIVRFRLDPQSDCGILRVKDVSFRPVNRKNTP